MSRPTLSARPQLETLEHRWNPAGTVRVSIDAAGNYLIAGDGAGNELRLEDGNLTGENGTAVVGPADIDTSNKVTFRLAGGDDKLLITGGMNFGKGLRVDLGSGSNAFELTGAGYTINGAFDIVQAAGPTPSETTSVKLASQPGDTFAILGPLTYTSSGRVDDTFEVGVGNANNAFVQGAITARLGAGENDADIRVLSAGGITIADQSAASQSYSINVSVPTVRGSVVATLGAGGGDFQATHSTVQGRFAVTNNPLSRSTVGISATLGEVAESFTVSSRSGSRSVLATFTKIGTHLTVAGGGSQFTNVSVTGAEVGQDVSVTNTGPDLVHTSVDVDKVGRDVRVTARGINGLITIDTDEVGRHAMIAVAGSRIGTGIQVDLGSVGGTARVSVSEASKANVVAAALKGLATATVRFTHVTEPTLNVQQAAGPVAVQLVFPSKGTVVVTDADQDVGVNVVSLGSPTKVTVRDSNVAGDLNLTATGFRPELAVENVAVAGDLVSRGTGKFVTNTITGGSIGGRASFAGGNQAGGSFRVQLDDVTVGSLSYVGGLGQNFLDLDTRAGLAGEVQVTGTTRVVLGAGHDEVTFGGLTTIDPAPLPDPQRHVRFLDDVFVGGGPGDDKLFNRNATFVPPAELTTDSIDVL
jgi:hypothetical protein